MTWSGEIAVRYIAKQAEKQSNKKMDTLQEMKAAIPKDVAPRGPPSRSGGGGGSAAGLTRGIDRNKSGGGPVRPGMQRRAPPKRSQSHKIGRPVFNASKEAAKEEFKRSIPARSKSGKLTRAAPLRTGSFQQQMARVPPGRAKSGTGLSRMRPTSSGLQRAPSGTGTDDDSVFTTASTQTMDSIALRKSQIDTSAVPGLRHGRVGGRRPAPNQVEIDGTGSVASESTFDFDDCSLHTVDSIRVHRNHVEHQGDDECDVSVFDESFVSTDTYMLSDYDEFGEEYGADDIEYLDDEYQEDELNDGEADALPPQESDEKSIKSNDKTEDGVADAAE